MNKTITVRKNEKYRIGISLFMIATGILFGIIIISTKSLPITLLVLPWFLLIFILWCYYETWQIIFEQKKIYKKVFSYASNNIRILKSKML